MTSMSNKIFEMFKNLKADAVPRPPRPEKSGKPKKERNENEENVDSTNEPEEILVESDEETKEDKKPTFIPFFKPSAKKKHNKSGKSNCANVNTQATGNVVNNVNAKNLRWGNDYYMGPTNMKQAKSEQEYEEPEEYVAKDNLIQLLLEANIKPEHEYLNYISKNLGKTWYSFFRTLGFTKGAIETMEIDTKNYGVSEARYKLLHSWMNNDDDGTLGRLATLLWEHGERQIVKELSLLYNKGRQK